MCVFGLMYNWTVFSPAVSAQLNVSAASVANVFSVCQICFCAGGVLSGFIYYRVPFRASMLIASLMIGVGLFLIGDGRGTDGVCIQCPDLADH